MKAAKYEASVSGVKDAEGAAALRKLVLALDGVAEVSVDEKNQTLTITMKAGSELSEETLCAALKDQPYSCTKFKRA
ncbi:MAG: hypothetical protein BroJett014_27000 [Planctomycetota bacterium]|nr:MAG: hypothetical protein BroJett014_27000 [Planctomycetota bacterium]